MKRIGLILLCLLVILPAALAQESPSYCAQLSEDDCALLSGGIENTNGAGSFNHSGFSLTLGGSGGTSTGNETSFTGSGPMLLGADGSIEAMHLSVEGEAFENGSGEIVLQDGVLYSDLPGEWQGLEAGSNDLLMGLISGNALLTAISEPGLAQPTRLEDTEQDGQAMAVFQSEIPFVEFLATPSMLELLVQLLTAAPSDMMGGMDASSMTPQDLAGVVPLFSMMMRPGQDSIFVTQWVGVDDGFIHHIEASADIVLDASMIDPSTGEIGFNFNFVTDMEGFGEEVSIEAPEEFTLTEDFGIDIGALAGTVAGEAAAPDPIEEASVAPIEQNIGYNEPVTGVLSAENPLDVYGFEGAAGDTISLVMVAAAPNSGFDSLIILQDADGNEIARNDDHDRSREELGPFDSLISEFSLPADGEYRLIATWPYQTRDGDYELMIEN
jgi:hypothetical protein